MKFNLEQFACEVCEKTCAKVSIVRHHRKDGHAADHVAYEYNDNIIMNYRVYIMLPIAKFSNRGVQWLKRCLVLPITRIVRILPILPGMRKWIIMQILRSWLKLL